MYKIVYMNLLKIFDFLSLFIQNETGLKIGIMLEIILCRNFNCSGKNIKGKSIVNENKYLINFVFVVTVKLFFGLCIDYFVSIT